MAKSELFSGTTGGTVKDTDIMAYKEEGVLSGDPKRIHPLSTMKDFFQGVLPDRVTQNEIDISLLRPSAGTSNQFVSEGGLFIPLYIYPGDIYNNTEFNRVIDLARSNNSLNIIVTINPGNGPGTVVDGNYTVAIDRLHSAGVVVTGYVSTAYTANTIEDVKLDIDKWIELYPEINGIFLDEMTNDVSIPHYEYYQELTLYTKRAGLTITLGNPGSTTQRAYFDYGCADIIFTREVSTFPTVAEAHEDWADGASSYFNKQRGMIVYGQPESGLSNLDILYPYYGWFYVTDDTLTNPYDTLPTYFETLGNKVSGLGSNSIASKIENKTATQKTTTIPKNITQAYTNLVQDPTDLTTANWSEVNGTIATATDMFINGLPLTKITCDGTLDPQIEQGIIVTASVKHTGTMILRNGFTTGSCQLFLLLSGENNALTVNWDNKTVSMNVGDSFRYNWIDDNTVQVWLTTVGDSADTTMEFRIDPPTSSTNGEFIYVTACQLVDNTTTAFPFVDGSKEADVIEEAFTMPDKFTLDVIIEPKFAYDTSAQNMELMCFYIDNSNRLLVFYEENEDNFQIYWSNGVENSNLRGQTFDDGSSFTNINQKIRVIGSLNLSSGGQGDSRLIVIPIEEGTLFEDSSWNNTPDIALSNFDTLFIGNANMVAEYEYLRIYDGLLVGDVTESLDVDVILQNQTLLFDANIDEFKETQIEAGTPTSTAIEMLAEDVKTGVAIQDDAIISRHIGEYNSRRFDPDRVDSEELPLGIITVPGWYKVAYIPSGAVYDSFGADFKLAARGGNRRGTISWSHLGHDEGGNNSDVDFKLTGLNLDAFLGVRHGYTLTGAGYGQLMEVYINPNNPTYDITGYMQLSNNIDSNPGVAGWILQTPILSDGLLPSGTSATYTEAGAELASIGTLSFTDTRFVAYSASTTVLRVALYFDEIPKQATTITFPVGFDFYTSEGTLVYSVTANENMPVFNIAGNVVTASITTTGLTTGLIGFGRGANFSAVLS